MLVLSRRIGETIVVNGDIYLTVVGITGGNVRLGVSAPSSVIVDREEVVQRKKNAALRTMPELARDAGKGILPR
jgi:carbon storage regulator